MGSDRNSRLRTLVIRVRGARTDSHRRQYGGAAHDAGHRWRLRSRARTARNVATRPGAGRVLLPRTFGGRARDLRSRHGGSPSRARAATYATLLPSMVVLERHIEGTPASCSSVERRRRGATGDQAVRRVSSLRGCRDGEKRGPLVWLSVAQGHSICHGTRDDGDLLHWVRVGRSAPARTISPVTDWASGSRTVEHPASGGAASRS